MKFMIPEITNSKTIAVKMFEHNKYVHQEDYIFSFVFCLFAFLKGICKKKLHIIFHETLITGGSCFLHD